MKDLYEINSYSLNNINTEDLWDIFRENYARYTGKNIDYNINDVNDFVRASVQNQEFKEHLERYMIFAISWIAANLINALSKAIKEVTEMNNEDLDPKSRFVIFDRMIKQLNDLIKLRSRMSEMIDEPQKVSKSKSKIDYSRLI